MLSGRPTAFRPALGGLSVRTSARGSPLRQTHVDQAREILAGQPVVGVHVASLLERPAPFRRRIRGVWLLRDPAGVLALAQRRRGISFAVAPRRRRDAGLADALAGFVRRSLGRADVVFGEERLIRDLLVAAGSHGVSAVEIRRQVLMATHPLWRPRAGRLAEEVPRELRLRAAEPADLPWLMDAHAAMCREDLGVDQVSRNRSGYEEYFESLIAAGQSTIGEWDGTPVFKAETPLESDVVRLVEGVYTVPDARGRGLASLAISRIAETAARTGRTTCLYVHLKNERARRIYRRVGFRSVAPWLTVTVRRGRGIFAPREL